MKSKALVSLLVTFVLSIPVAPQQSQPQEDQDSVVRITTNLVQVDAVVTKDGPGCDQSHTKRLRDYRRRPAPGRSPIFLTSRMFPIRMLK